jgi:hypothetical protein
LIYERRVRSKSAVRKELLALDGDAGMRLRGTFGGMSCLAFVSRFGRTYTVVVCAAKGRSGHPPGKVLASKEFTEVDQTMVFLTALTGPRMEAHVY